MEKEIMDQDKGIILGEPGAGVPIFATQEDYIKNAAIVGEDNIIVIDPEKDEKK